MLSRLVIAFLPRSKHLLISWVQSPSAVILEPPKIKSLTVSIGKFQDGGGIRPLSPPQIHQKIIWMLNNFHKTTSEHWRRTPGTQKGSPFSLKGGHLYLLPPPSLLYLTLWISLGVLGCGEHLRNWLLAGSVSLLLTPPFILLATSVSFLPLLFSV